MLRPTTKALLAVALAMTVASLLACGPLVKNGVPVSTVLEAAAAAPPLEYRIHAGDEIRIKFALTPELDAEQVVRPDGRITVAYLQDVEAAGMTTAALAEALRNRLSAELVHPEIAVTVLTFAQYKVHVGGEVRNSGVIDLVAGRSVIQAVFEAGGFTPEARVQEVLVIRRSGDAGRPIVIPVDLKAALHGDDTTQDIALMPFDAVFVPRSRIANANKWVEQYLRNMLPVDFVVRPEDFE